MKYLAGRVLFVSFLLFLFSCAHRSPAGKSIIAKQAIKASLPLLEKYFDFQVPVLPSSRSLYPTVTELPGKPFVSPVPVTGRNMTVGTYQPPPRTPAAFPELHRAPPRSGRTRWKDADGNIYEWDGQHGSLEKYDRRGRHRGEYDPNTGSQTKPPDPSRRVEP